MNRERNPGTIRYFGRHCDATSWQIGPGTRILGTDWAERVCWLAVATKVFVLFTLALNARFVMDEFWQFGQAKHLGNGFFDTIWPGKAVGYALFYKPAHLLGWDATSMLLAGRLQTVLLGCAVLLIVYAMARAIGESRLRALLIVLLLLCFSTFMERIFRTRSEPLAVFFGAAALLAIAQGNADSWRRLLLAGVLSGLAFLSTQKAVYFNVSLGLALLADAAANRQYFGAMRRGSLLAAGWTLPVIFYCFGFGGGNPVPVAVNLFTAPIEVATSGQTYYDNLHIFVYQTLLRNALLYICCALGLFMAFREFRGLAPPRRIALVFTILITALIFVHNQPWPYVFIMALPFLALWGLAPYDLAAARSKQAFAGLFVVIVVFSFWRNIAYLEHANSGQLAVIETAESLLPEGGTYFDGIGMLPNRVDSPPVWLDVRRVRLVGVDGTDSELYRALAEAPPGLVIRSYRTEALNFLLQPLLQSRYYPISPNIMLPGRSLPVGGNVTFDVPVAGAYGLYDKKGAPVAGSIQVDGVWQELPVHLNAKVYTLLAKSKDTSLVILPAGASPGPLPAEVTPVPLFEGVYTF